MRHHIRHVRAAHECSGEHRVESEGLSDHTIFIEYIRMYIFDDVELLALRLEILTDRENLATGLDEALHHRDDFVAPFAESQHESRFRHDRWVVAFDLAQQRQRSFETRAGADVVV